MGARLSYADQQNVGTTVATIPEFTYKNVSLALLRPMNFQ